MITSMVRLATPEDMNSIYMMGYDVWGEGETQSNYLSQCDASPKYKRGHWYVLKDSQGIVVSSLITYRLSPESFGIGSIATPPELRRKGLAGQLIQEVLSILSRQGAKTIFLFSDIKPDFYFKFGFKPLPTQFQNHKDSLCMAWGTNIDELVRQPGFAPPAYF